MTEKRMTEEPPPTSKTMRYDRQLRLWGDEGQSALENASVCLLNATTLGCEILKNLVLPGVGEVCIVDGKNVSSEDIQTNFFLAVADLGKSRAECVTKTIGQLNPEVKLTVYNLGVTEFIHSHLNILKRFTVFVVSNLALSEYKELAQVAWDSNIPLLIANIVGVYTEIRLVVKEHDIIESKPDTPLPDLRLDKPFTELIDFYQNIDFSEYSATEHAHIPFVIILLKCLDLWKTDHGGEIPKNYQEKTEFKKLVSNLRRKSDEENFKEASANVNKCITKFSLPSHIQDLFDDPSCSVSSSSSPFWVTAAAVKQFYTIKGVLPVSGVLDDMTADSQSFIALQNLYRKKAQADADVVAGYVADITTKNGIPTGHVNPDYINKFSKHSLYIRVLRTPAAEKCPEEVRDALETFFDDPLDLGHVILLFEAYQNFVLDKRRCPGDTDEHLAEDETELSEIVSKIQTSYSLPLISPSLFIRDFVRYGGCEIPSVAAFSGGIAAHECIKLITKQYVPVNNCFVYSGGTQTTSVYTL